MSTNNRWSSRLTWKTGIWTNTKQLTTAGLGEAQCYTRLKDDIGSVLGSSCEAVQKGQRALNVCLDSLYRSGYPNRRNRRYLRMLYCNLFRRPEWLCQQSDAIWSSAAKSSTYVSLRTRTIHSQT